MVLKTIKKYLKSINKNSLIIITVVIGILLLKKTKESFETGEIGKINKELNDGDIIYIKDHKQRYLTFHKDNKTISFTGEKNEHSELEVVKNPKNGNLSFFNKTHEKYFNSNDDNTFNQVGPKHGASRYKEDVWTWSEYVLYNTDYSKVTIKTAYLKTNNSPAYIISTDDGKIIYSSFDAPPTKERNPNEWKYRFDIEIEYESAIKEAEEKALAEAEEKALAVEVAKKAEEKALAEAKMTETVEAEANALEATEAKNIAIEEAKKAKNTLDAEIKSTEENKMIKNEIEKALIEKEKKDTEEKIMENEIKELEKKASLSWFSLSYWFSWISWVFSFIGIDLSSLFSWFSWLYLIPVLIILFFVIKKKRKK